jgi:hypothetical protein
VEARSEKVNLLRELERRSLVARVDLFSREQEKARINDISSSCTDKSLGTDIERWMELILALLIMMAKMAYTHWAQSR